MRLKVIWFFLNRIRSIEAWLRKARDRESARVTPVVLGVSPTRPRPVLVVKRTDLDDFVYDQSPEMSAEVRLHHPIPNDQSHQFTGAWVRKGVGNPNLFS